jgi:hypothetical protein
LIVSGLIHFTRRRKQQLEQLSTSQNLKQEGEGISRNVPVWFRNNYESEINNLLTIFQQKKVHSVYIYIMPPTIETLLDIIQRT